MTLNNKQQIAQKLLEDLGITSSTNCKQWIICFAQLYGEKLIRKCLQIKGHRRGKISIEDIRSTYQLMKHVHSPDYEDRLKEAKNNLINKVNEITLEECVQQGEQNVLGPQTVKLYLKNEIDHMLTSKDHQLAFN